MLTGYIGRRRTTVQYSQTQRHPFRADAQAERHDLQGAFPVLVPPAGAARVDHPEGARS